MMKSRSSLSALIALAAGIAAAQGMTGPGFPSLTTPARRRVSTTPDRDQRASKRAEIKAWNAAVDARKKAKKGNP